MTDTAQELLEAAQFLADEAKKARERMNHLEWEASQKLNAWKRETHSQRLIDAEREALEAAQALTTAKNAHERADARKIRADVVLRQVQYE